MSIPDDISAIAASSPAPLQPTTSTSARTGDSSSSPPNSQQQQQQHVMMPPLLPASSDSPASSPPPSHHQLQQLLQRQQQTAGPTSSPLPGGVTLLTSSESCPVHGSKFSNIRRLNNNNNNAARSGNNNDDNHDVFNHPRRCTCTRKAPLVNLKRESIITYSNTQRHQKSQSEQLRQYKDEAMHLSKVSRAFREENSRLQRLLEEKARSAAEAEEKASREARRHHNVDDERLAWTSRLDDLREENDTLTNMASKSRSEADHLRAALEQAIGENLKLRSALTQKNEELVTAASAQQQQQQQQQQAVVIGSGSGSSCGDPEFVQQRKGTTTSAATTTTTIFTPPPVVSASNFPQSTKLTATSATDGAHRADSVALIEDLNALRSAIKELRRAAQNAGSTATLGGVTSTSIGGERRCANTTDKHRFSPLTYHPTTGQPMQLMPCERVESAMDSVRQRVIKIEKDLQSSQEEAARWHEAAMEMKNILDCQNVATASHGEAVARAAAAAAASYTGMPQQSQQQQQQQRQQQQQQHETDNNRQPIRHSHRVEVPGPNPRSATAGVTNLESQLAWAKGQIATLDHQLQATQKHMDAELGKLRSLTADEVAEARALAAADAEKRIREEVRRTTSGAFLEELSRKVNEYERKISQLELSFTTSEATKRQQRTEIETLRTKLETESKLAARLEPTKRQLARAEEECRVLAVKANHADGTIDALKSAEARLAEEILSLRGRATAAESRVAELHNALNSASLKLHQNEEENKELRERVESTIEQERVAASEQQQVLQDELQSAHHRLCSEAKQRVDEEARAGALESNLRSVREEVERIRRVRLHW